MTSILNLFNPLNLVSHVGNQGQLPRARDRGLQRALVLGAGARDAARLDLAPLRDERRQQPDVLVVDVVDLVRAELADAAPAEEAAAARPLALALVLVVLLGAAATAASASTFRAHRCTSAPSMLMSSISSPSRSPRRSLGS